MQCSWRKTPVDTGHPVCYDTDASNWIQQLYQAAMQELRGSQGFVRLTGGRHCGVGGDVGSNPTRSKYLLDYV